MPYADGLRAAATAAYVTLHIHTPFITLTNRRDFIIIVIVVLWFVLRHIIFPLPRINIFITILSIYIYYMPRKLFRACCYYAPLFIFTPTLYYHVIIRLRRYYYAWVTLHFSRFVGYVVFTHYAIVWRHAITHLCRHTSYQPHTIRYHYCFIVLRHYYYIICLFWRHDIIRYAARIFSYGRHMLYLYAIEPYDVIGCLLAIIIYLLLRRGLHHFHWRLPLRHNIINGPLKALAHICCFSLHWDITIFIYYHIIIIFTPTIHRSRRHYIIHIYRLGVMAAGLSPPY